MWRTHLLEMSRRPSSSRRLRVTVNVAGSSGPASLPKLILVPDSLQELLDDATKKLEMPQCARYAWTRDGEPIQSISAIHDNQLVLVSSTSRYPGRRSTTARTAPTSPPTADSGPPQHTPARDLPEAAEEAQPPVRPPPIVDAQAARIQQAAKRHAELVDSVRVGERLVRELRQQVEKLRNRSAEERRKVDGLRTQADELSTSIALKQRELEDLASRAAAATPPRIRASAVSDTDEDGLSRTDTARGPSNKEREAIARSQDQVRTLEVAIRVVESQLEERTAELATAKAALAEQQQVADARERELAEALRGRDGTQAQASELAARQQRSIDELEARFLSEVESRAAAEQQWQKERGQIRAEWQAEVDRVKSETLHARSETQLAELKCQAIAKAAEEAAAAAASEQSSMEQRFRAELQAMEAAHATEKRDLQMQQTDELARARAAFEVAVATHREEAQAQELARARAEMEDLQGKFDTQATSAASMETEIASLRQKLTSVQAELDEARRTVAAAAAAAAGTAAAGAAPPGGGPQVALPPVSTSPKAGHDKGEQLVSVSKDRLRQVGKKAPTRGRQGRSGVQTASDSESASTMPPPIVAEAVASPASAPTVGAPALTEAQSIAASKKRQQEAAAEAARQRRANKQVKAPSAGGAAVEQSVAEPVDGGAVPGHWSAQAAVPAPAVSSQGGAGAAASTSDEMKGNAVFLKMQARIREEEAKEDARCVECSNSFRLAMLDTESQLPVSVPHAMRADSS